MNRSSMISRGSDGRYTCSGVTFDAAGTSAYGALIDGVSCARARGCGVYHERTPTAGRWTFTSLYLAPGTPGMELFAIFLSPAARLKRGTCAGAFRADRADDYHRGRAKAQTHQPLRLPARTGFPADNPLRAGPQ